MDPQRLQQIEELYHSARERSPEARAALLAGTDPELRREVESLLAQDALHGPMERPAVELLEDATTQLAAAGLLDRRQYQPGDTIGHYRIKGMLGKGGMGEVWHATDTKLGRDVAVKVLPARFALDPERMVRFEREAKVLASLNHPNIAQIFGLEDRALVMELVEGETLKGPLPLETALDYAQQIADAVAAAHDKGIVHRDLKPGNIMVTAAGVVKVLDFGLARVAEPGENNAHDSPTRTGVILGTPAYMAPEQARGKAVDKRADIWAFGCVLYEMLTGKPAFTGDNATDILAAVVNTEPDFARVPVKVRRLLRRCLEKDPQKRLRDIGDIWELLEEKPETSISSQSRFSKAGWIVAGAFAISFAVLAFLHFRQTAPASLTAVPFTAYPGSERFPTFSPDGNQVAFSWNGDNQDNFDIYVKLLGPGTPLRLTTDPAEDFSPTWAPDGRSIAFLRRRFEGRVAVVLISPLGGPERVVAETRDVTRGMYETSGSLAWTPDSNHLVVLDKSSADEPVALFLLSIETGDKQRLTRPPSYTVGDNGPAISPDGRMLAFTRTTGISVNDLYVADLSPTLSVQGSPRRLTFDNRKAYNPAWLPGGKEVIFSSNRAGLFRLWRIGVTGGQSPQRVEGVGEDAFYPAVSRQGHRLAYTRSWTDYNIWRVELPAISGSGISSGNKSSLFISSSRSDVAPNISRDGKRVAFHSDRSGFGEIWAADSTGLNPVQLSRVASYTGSPSWSPDGARIAFDCNIVGHFEVYIMTANGGKPMRLTNGVADSAIPRWSRDGKWIYFHSTRNGESQIWKVASTGGSPIQVTRKGGYTAAESEDGAFLFYTKTDRVSGLWRMPVAGGEETRILDAVSMRSFAVTKDGIYFLAPEPSARTALAFHNFATNRDTVLRMIEKPVWFYLDVSPDERWLLYTQRDQVVENLMLVENFR